MTSMVTARISRIIPPSLVGLCVLAVLVALPTPVRGQVADNKTFTVDVDGRAGDAAYAGDTDAQIVVTLSNTSSHQALNSANVVVPDPLVVVAAEDDTDPTTSTIELRDLGIAPGGTASFTFVVDVRTCTAAASGAFQVRAKQSNTFLGTGNDFFLDAGSSDLTVDIVRPCRLAFVAQPGDAKRRETITSADYDPDAAPITVEVRDAGDTGRATHATPTVTLTAGNPAVAAPDLGGTTSATAVAGLSTFDPGPTLSPSASGYALVASTDAHQAATSAPFDIVDDRVACAAGQPCATSAQASNGGQQVTATFGTGATTTSLTLSLGAADALPLTCDGAVPTTRAVAQYSFTGGDGEDRTGTVALTIPDASQPLKTYEVCWAAPYRFVTDGGGQAARQGEKAWTGEPLFVGVLPDCAVRGEPARPCVAGRSFDRRSATATVVIAADGRDPWARS